VIVISYAATCRTYDCVPCAISLWMKRGEGAIVASKDDGSQRRDSVVEMVASKDDSSQRRDQSRLWE